MMETSLQNLQIATTSLLLLASKNAMVSGFREVFQAVLLSSTSTGATAPSNFPVDIMRSHKE
jgi:hypothetical protein